MKWVCARARGEGKANARATQERPKNNPRATQEHRQECLCHGRVRDDAGVVGNVGAPTVLVLYITK
jgi:hypothetical protein